MLMSKYILLTVLCLVDTISHAQTKNFIDQPYIEVSGSSDSLVTPDQIFIKIVLSERETKNKVSVEEQEVKMIAALKSIGVNTETNLTLNDFASSFRFYFLKQKDVLKTKNYMLKVVDAATVSKVFLELEKLDISNAVIDRVDHTNIEGIKNICRARAIGIAKIKAVSLTQPLSQTIGPAINIMDFESNAEGTLQGRVAGLSIRLRGETGFGNDKYEPPQIEFEKIKIKQSVNVKFILK